MCVCIRVLFLLFLLFGNSCADNSSAADKQQCDPQHEVACVAGLRRLRQLRRYDVGFGDFLGAGLVTVMLSAAFAVPILDIALGILGRRLCIDMLQVGVVLRVKLTVVFAANFAYRFFGAGCLAAGMIGDHLSAEVADMVFVRILVIGNHFATVIAYMILIRVFVVRDYLFAEIADMIFV